MQKTKNVVVELRLNLSFLYCEFIVTMKKEGFFFYLGWQVLQSITQDYIKQCIYCYIYIHIYIYKQERIYMVEIKRIAKKITGKCKNRGNMSHVVNNRKIIEFRQKIFLGSLCQLFTCNKILIYFGIFSYLKKTQIYKNAKLNKLPCSHLSALTVIKLLCLVLVSVNCVHTSLNSP